MSETISHFDYDNPLIRLSSPTDVLAIVPHLLGFHPSDSIVVISFDRGAVRLQCVMRFELPACSADLPKLVDDMVAALGRNSAGYLILIGYGPAGYVTPALDAVRTAAEGADFEVVEVLRTEENRYWSYLCHDPACCSIDGVPFDPTGNQAAVEAVLAGFGAYPDRDAFSQVLAPVEGDAREEMRAATRAARARAETLLETADAHPWYQEGLERLTSALEHAHAGNEPTAEDIAWLGLILTSIIVRDVALSFVGRYPDETHMRLWTAVTCGVEPEYVAAPASILAFVAYRTGDGPLARVALDRAIAVKPGYRFADLIGTALDAGLPPAKLAEIDFAELAPDVAAQAKRNPASTRPVLPKGR